MSEEVRLGTELKVHNKISKLKENIISSVQNYFPVAFELKKFNNSQDDLLWLDLKEME